MRRNLLPRLARMVFCAAVLHGMGAALPGTVMAYRTAADEPDFEGAVQPVAWATVPDVAFDGPLPDGLDSSVALEALRAAAAAWSGPDCTSLAIRAEATSGDTDAIKIRWTADWTEEGYDLKAPASTDITYKSTGNATWVITHAAIALNSEDHPWDGSGPDLQAILTHELGHALGLLHVCEERGLDGAPTCEQQDASYRLRVMYPRYSEPPRRALDADDAAGICHLYPRSGAPDPDEVAPVSEACEASPSTDESCRPSCEGATCARLQLGDPCASAAECASSHCTALGTCSQACNLMTPCPAGFACEPGDAVQLECHGMGLALGEPCSRGDECTSRYCIQSSLVKDDDKSTESYCTRECSAEAPACPATLVCASIVGRAVCVRPADLKAPPSGCAIASVPAREGTPVWLALGLVGSSVIWRRRRVSENP